MVARTLVRSRSSIGSNPASPASSEKLAVSGNLVHGVISLAVAAAGLGGCKSPGDYAAFKFPPLPRHDPGGPGLDSLPHLRPFRRSSVRLLVS